MFDNLLEQLMELKTVLSDMMTEEPNEQPDTWGHMTTSGSVLAHGSGVSVLVYLGIVSISEH